MPTRQRACTGEWVQIKQWISLSQEEDAEDPLSLSNALSYVRFPKI